MPRRIGRRSFLTQVAGGGLAAAAGLIVFGAEGEARPKHRPPPRQMLVDADPRDPARPLPQTHARPTMAAPHRAYTGSAGQTGDGRTPVSRFVVCPGSPRCPRHNP